MPDDLAMNDAPRPMAGLVHPTRLRRSARRRAAPPADLVCAAGLALETLDGFLRTPRAARALSLGDGGDPDRLLRRLILTAAPISGAGSPLLRFAQVDRDLGGIGPQAVIAALELRRALPMTLHVRAVAGQRETMLAALLGAADAAVALGRRTRALEDRRDLALAFYHAMRDGAVPAALPGTPAPGLRRIHLAGRKAHAILRTRAEIDVQGARAYVPT